MPKCARCGKLVDYFTNLFWKKGPNGARRYDICNPCKPFVEADNKPEKKEKVDG